MLKKKRDETKLETKKERSTGPCVRNLDGQWPEGWWVPWEILLARAGEGEREFFFFFLARGQRLSTAREGPTQLPVESMSPLNNQWLQEVTRPSPLSALKTEN